MGWSNIGSVSITATSVILVNSSGTVVGSLDGQNGLVLIGDGTAAQPDMTLTPLGDLVWTGGLSPLLTDSIGIHVGAFPNKDTKDILGIQIGSGSLNNRQEAYCVPFSAPSDGSSSAAVMMVPFATGQDLTVSASPFSYPESWHNLTLQNGWAAAGGSFHTPSFRNMGDGTVLLRGSMAGGTTTTGTTVATLPTAYRPDLQTFFTTNGNGPGATFAITILPTGAINISQALGSTSLTLDGVRFPLAAFS